MKVVICFVVLFFLTSKLDAQKQVVDKTVCNNWESLKHIANTPCLLTNDGRYLAYQFGSKEKGDCIVIKSITNNFFKIFHNGRNPVFSANSKLFLILKGDSLHIEKLDSEEDMIISRVSDFTYVDNGEDGTILYRLIGDNWNLIKKNLSNSREVIFPSVKSFQINRQQTEVLLCSGQRLSLANLFTGEEIAFEGSGEIISYNFSDGGNKIAFLSSSPNQTYLKWFKKNQSVFDSVGLSDLPSGYSFSNTTSISFSKDEKKIFFDLNKSSSDYISDSVITKAINVWSHKDELLLDAQVDYSKSLINKNYPAILNLESKKIVVLDATRYQGIYQGIYGTIGEDFSLVESKINENEYYWNGQKKSLSVFFFNDGNVKKIIEAGYPGIYIDGINALSGDKHYVVWYDRRDQQFYSYGLLTGKVVSISQKIPEKLGKSANDDAELKRDIGWPYGIAGWLDHKYLLINSRNDIWKVDVRGIETPVNITSGYGKKNDIIFRICFSSKPTDHKGVIVFIAFHNRTKENGFYSININKINKPDSLFMGNYLFSFNPSSPLVFSGSTDPASFSPMRSKSGIFIVRRMSSSEQANFFSTRDFKKFRQLTNIGSESGVPFVRSQLITWSIDGCKRIDAVMHLPIDLDKKKKYPVIFNYYQQRTSALNVFREPELAGSNLNIPWYVTRDYIVIEPDFYYKTGSPAKSIIDVIESCVRYIARFPFIDTSRMGIQGHSFGGYETNVIATGSTLFKAACEAAGPSNIFTEYGSLRPNGYSNQTSADYGQRNLAVFPWDNPEVFLANSPALHLRKITTPLLIMHNKKDGAISFTHALEMFLGMRRLRKPVWLLEYDGEDHQIRSKVNQLDYTIRMQQYFDHYLKGKPAPIWMTQSMPLKDKGRRSGLNIDATGKCSSICPVCNPS
jgi:hypothetical protein